MRGGHTSRYTNSDSEVRSASQRAAPRLARVSFDPTTSGSRDMSPARYQLRHLAVTVEAELQALHPEGGTYALCELKLNSVCCMCCMHICNTRQTHLPAEISPAECTIKRKKRTDEQRKKASPENERAVSIG
ncbi:hypothetical protein PCASD_14398 [Puccinia coronata f. sp. avenae]|uniref:Uncharacterized protein n=1 Tax=Puccinia coronata f. sp. avenae TaxID=200324 RepID=A0A2N5U6T1_9BASI|nr:hypothetical protein PCASD_14398 [Puccinia coronata f. sp. avenae]